jgi:hypothetical protein
VVFYCGKECQKGNWETHKKVCLPYQNAASALVKRVAAQTLPAFVPDSKTSIGTQVSAAAAPQSWIDALQPVSNAKLQNGRQLVLNFLSKIFEARRHTFAHCDDPLQFRGFFYATEVVNLFKPGRIPADLEPFSKTALMHQEHRKQFSGLQRYIKYPDRSLKAFLKLVFTKVPMILDCSGFASLALLLLYDCYYPGDQIAADFIGYPPESMFEIAVRTRTVSQSLRNVLDPEELNKNRPLRVQWLILKEKYSSEDLVAKSIRLQPFDLCYLTNDLRYDNYSQSEQGSAFVDGFSGFYGGQWIIYVGKDQDGQDLYLGFAKENPLTVEGWQSHLREGFLEKWGQVPDDWSCSANWYLSPFRGC